MSIEVVMPKFGLTMLEGTIQQWFKAEGQPVSAGERLFEVETEKVLYEVEAPAGGVLARVLYAAEATVSVATVVAVIAEPGEAVEAVAGRYAQAPAAAAKAAAPTPAATQAPAAVGREPAATPAARRLAKDSGVDLAAVAGTGPGGRITREDVEAAAVRTAAAPKAEPLRGMRKAIAQRMRESLRATAQLTITTEADVTPMARRRRALQEQFALTYTDLIVEAAAGALREHPHINATADETSVCRHAEVDIGLAVSVGGGLIVPVIRNADKKTLREIAAEARALAEKARAGTLSVDEVSGGTFTVTNLGMYGVDAFTPILHTPQVAILGVGRVVEKPAVRDGKVAVRSMMTLSLTFDHRIVDGAPAAEFLQTIVRRLSETGPS